MPPLQYESSTGSYRQSTIPHVESHMPKSKSLYAKGKNEFMWGAPFGATSVDQPEEDKPKRKSRGKYKVSGKTLTRLSAKESDERIKKNT